MSDASIGKLRSLLQAYAERKAQALHKRLPEEGERQRRACGDILRTVVLPVLDSFMVELKNAGHEASTRDDTDRDDAYPSVALSFTPRARLADRPDVALASALIFRYDPQRGILAHRDVKPSPAKGRVGTGSGDRLGTIGVDVVSAPWVETKTLSFIEAVLKAN